MAGSILGTRVLRTEDPELLLGNAKYVGDLDLGDDMLHLVFVRSEMAHAEIAGVDTSQAAAAPGVVAVWTADDLGLPPFQSMAAVLRIRRGRNRKPRERDNCYSTNNE